MRCSMVLQRGEQVVAIDLDVCAWPQTQQSPPFSPFHWRERATMSALHAFGVAGRPSGLASSHGRHYVTDRPASASRARGASGSMAGPAYLCAGGGHRRR